MNSLNRLNLYLMPFFTAIFSIYGLLYLDWSLFHIVYLFWFENLIKILFQRLKTASVNEVIISGKILKARDAGGNLLHQIRSDHKTRLFMYFIFFIFIFFLIGLVMPAFETDKEKGLKGIYDFARVIGFADWQFNLALFTVVLDELISYFRDFRSKYAIYKNRPYRVKVPFDRADVTLLLTILTGFSVFALLRHPSSPLYGNTMISPMYFTGIFLVLLILMFQFFAVRKEIKDEQKISEQISGKLEVSEIIQKNSLPR